MVVPTEFNERAGRDVQTYSDCKLGTYIFGITPWRANGPAIEKKHCLAVGGDTNEDPAHRESCRGTAGGLGPGIISFDAGFLLAWVATGDARRDGDCSYRWNCMARG